MLKQAVKNIVKKIGEGTLEVVKDSARQIGKTVSPGTLLEQAIGPKKESEFTTYLKNLDEKNLTPEEFEKKKQELAQKDKTEAEKVRALLGTPTHMKLPQKPKSLRPYEAAIQEEERKKALAIEAQKKHPQPLMQPMSKQARGMLGAKKRPKSSDFEAGKNIKVG